MRPHEGALRIGADDLCGAPSRDSTGLLVQRMRESPN